MDGQFLEHLGECLKDRPLFQGAQGLFPMLIDIVALEFASDYLEGLKGRLLFQAAQKLFHPHINSLEHLDASWNFMDGACLRACVPVCLRACVPACTRACILLFLEIAPPNIR